MKKVVHFAASFAALGVVSLLGGCGAPQVSDAGDGAAPAIEMHQEDAITQVAFDPGHLETLAIADAQTKSSFDLDAISVASAFDRVGLTWQSIDAGGDTSFQVEADESGTWIPLIVDSQEFVPETGTTFYAGHAALPAGTTAVRARAVLRRSDATLASPQLLDVGMEMLDFASVAEGGEAIDPSNPVVEDPDPADVAGFTGSASDFTAPNVVSRATWGARAPVCSGTLHTPYRLTFHETVTPNGEIGAAARARMRQIQAFHINTRGWCDIGYHFTVDASGVIYRGRITTHRTGAHVLNQNTGNIGFALLGTYEGHQPGTAQLKGLEHGFAWMVHYYHITIDGSHIRGHRQWPGQSTSCPSNNVLAKKASILSGIHSFLNASVTDPPPPPPAAAVIVDNASSGFSASGSWWAGTSQPDRYGSNYSVRSTASTSDEAKWSANLPAGKYTVYVWYTQGSNRASAAPYFVYSKAGSTKKTIDQRANGGRWVSLGTYDMAGGTMPRVGLSCWTNTGTYVVADAVKFVPQ